MYGRVESTNRRILSVGKLWASIVGLFAGLSAVLYVLRNRDKVKAAEDKQKQVESARIASEDATEALVRGLTEETNETTNNPRDYDFRD